MRRARLPRIMNGSEQTERWKPWLPSVRTLSLTNIVTIFLVLPMDSILRLLRIERLNLPARAAFGSKDAAS